MISMRAILYAGAATLVGLGLALALFGAAKALNPRSRHMIYSNDVEHGRLKAVLDVLYTGSSPKANPEAEKVASPVAGGNPLRAIPLSSLPVTRQRPIFLPSRRPARGLELASAQSQPAAPVTQSRPNLTLLGTIAGETDGTAIFLDETSKSIVRLKTGEGRLGWKLQLVSRRQATLQKGSETAIFVLPNSAAK
jgi:hypothetical protein